MSDLNGTNNSDTIILNDEQKSPTINDLLQNNGKVGLDDIMANNAEKLNTASTTDYSQSDSDRNTLPKFNVKINETEPLSINILSKKKEMEQNSGVIQIPKSYSSPKNTLNESIITTINRDLYSIYIKLIFVINPFISDEVKKYHIKQWDLWGPLIFNVLLASTLAINSDNRGQTIILIFLIFWLGSFLVFLNGHLLGVKTSIFQIFCLLGYCLFPLNISAFIFSFTRPPDILKFIVIGLTCFWSLFSASSYLGNLTIPEQRYLVLYPCILLYLYISWFIFSIKH